jgi:transportin-1
MEFGQLPRAEYYLAAVFLDSRCGGMVRGMAGLMLKNGVRERRAADDALVAFLLRGDALLRALQDEDGMVRATAGSLIAGLFQAGGGKISSWPTALAHLYRLAASSDPTAALAATETLEKVCEDCGEAMVYEDPEGLAFLVEALLKLVDPAGGKAVALRKRALHALNYLIGYGPEAVLNRLDDVIAVLSANGSEARLRAVVCQSLNVLFGCWPLELLDHLPALMAYTFDLMGNAHSDESTALEACEFWLALAGFRSEGVFEIGAVLEDGFLAGELLPVLMRNAMYSDSDPDVIAVSDDGGDHDDEVMPRHHTTRHHDGVEEGELDEDDEGEGEARGEEEDDYQWNLRKCSAATIDALSHALPPAKLLPAIIPLLQSYLSSEDDWKRLEVGILVLGAIAVGCGEAIEAHLPGLWPGLCAMMRHPKPLVRSIAAWTCGRYACWAEEQGLGDSVKAAIEGLADPVAKVQLACCAALQVYSQRAKTILKSCEMPLNASLEWALQSYTKRKTLVACLELIHSLLDYEFDDHAIMIEMSKGGKEALLLHWRRILQSDVASDPVAFPLLEAIAVVPMPAETNLELFLGALHLANGQLAKPDEGDIEYDVIIVAMDLIGGVVTRGHASHFEGLEDAGKLTLRALSLGPTELHQSAFGLLGDLASSSSSSPSSPSCMEHVFPVASREMALALLHYALLAEAVPSGGTSLSTANNAVWAFGVMALNAPWAISKIAGQMTKILCDALKMDDGSSPRLRGYTGNVVVALGRALRTAEDPLALLRVFPMAKWIRGMRLVDDRDERLSALEPVLHLVGINPALVSPEDLHALHSIPH